MNRATSIPPAPVGQQAPPSCRRRACSTMRVATSDSGRSLRAARGSLLLTTGTAYHRKESKGGRPKTAGITLDGMNEH